MTNSFDQRPSEAILYRQPVVNDEITNATWTISPAGPTVSKQEQTATDTTALVSNLTANLRYVLTVLVHCASGQVIERSCNIRCQ